MKLIRTQNGIPFAESSTGSDLLLRAEHLCPGDIVLSRGSATIAAATRGPYSHALLVFNQTTAFESRQDGVGLSHLQAVRCERDPATGEPNVLVRAEDPSPVRGVFRHRRIYTIPPEVVTQTLNGLLDEELGLEYPDFETVRSAAPNLSWIPIFVFRKGQAKSRRKPAVNPGSFCSELVAKFFARLGLPIDSDVPPESYSPNRLGRSPSLRFECGLVVEPDPYAETDEQYLAALGEVKGLSREVLAVMVEAGRVIKESEQILRDLDET